MTLKTSGSKYLSILSVLGRNSNAWVNRTRHSTSQISRKRICGCIIGKNKHKTIDYIKEAGRVYVVEAEKGVLQGYSYGTRNIVATGGKEFSKTQIEMLTRLGVQIVLCLDKDVSKSEIEELSNKFADGIPIYYIYDEDNILSEKEAPTDNPKKWDYLIKNNIYRIK